MSEQKVVTEMGRTTVATIITGCHSESYVKLSPNVFLNANNMHNAYVARQLTVLLV